MAQMKRNMMNTIRAGKSGSGVRRMKQAPASMFRPTNPRPVVDFMRGTCSMDEETPTERKDRILGD